MFIGRETELLFLDERYQAEGGQLIILYGRRRVGKTETLRECCKTNSSIPAILQNLWDTEYKQWAVKKKSGQGHKPVIRLRFSKSGDPDIERWYSTHFIDAKKIAELKEQRMTEIAPSATAALFPSTTRSRTRTAWKPEKM